MYIIYKGKYLTITYLPNESLFVQNWLSSPENVTAFKKEMINYTSLYQKYRPNNTLWLQQNYDLILDYETHLWIEKKVNEPIVAYGNEKCALVVGNSVIPHLGVIDAFEKIKSCINLKHFGSEDEAKKWLKTSSKNAESKQFKKITFAGIDAQGNAIFKIPSENIDVILKSLNDSINKEKLEDFQQEKYALLTKREKEILALLVDGKKLQEIAKHLFLSVHTVRTHWKNIKLKLNSNNNNVILSFFKQLKM